MLLEIQQSLKIAIVEYPNKQNKVYMYMTLNWNIQIFSLLVCDAIVSLSYFSNS
jgi:hypothetical protein